AISILLIIATQVVDRQLTYIQNKKLGFDREHILILPIFLKDRDHKTNNEPWLAARYNVIKKTFTDHPNIQSASAFRFLPGRGGGFVRIVKPEGQENTEWRMPVQEADESFFDTLGIPLLAGRTFSPEVERDRTHAYILNETAVKSLGWTVQNAVGKRFGRARSDEDAKGTVIGVVQDFHYASLREKIAPAAFAYRQWFYDFLALRIQDFETTRPFLKKTWKSFMPPDKPFSATFLNDEINQVYEAERRFGKTATAFSTLAVFLACLGLFGLASFTAEMRTREFGIRKVLGASVPGLVLLLSREFTRLVLFANLLAWPLAYYAMNQWLQGFAYRIDLSLGAFLIGGLLALLIALLTVSYQALKAATTNPIDTLRYE
ncbi:MAG: ABC transporter permease, partial [bacterium]|nr:ABC transporter permease [bacterium]